MRPGYECWRVYAVGVRQMTMEQTPIQHTNTHTLVLLRTFKLSLKSTTFLFLHRIYSCILSFKEWRMTSTHKSVWLYVISLLHSFDVCVNLGELIWIATLTRQNNVDDILDVCWYALNNWEYFLQYYHFRTLWIAKHQTNTIISHNVVE